MDLSVDPNIAPVGHLENHFSKVCVQSSKQRKARKLTSRCTFVLRAHDPSMQVFFLVAKKSSL